MTLNVHNFSCFHSTKFSLFFIVFKIVLVLTVLDYLRFFLFHAQFSQYFLFSQFILVFTALNFSCFHGTKISKFFSFSRYYFFSIFHGTTYSSSEVRRGSRFTQQLDCAWPTMFSATAMYCPESVWIVDLISIV